MNYFSSSYVWYGLIAIVIGLISIIDNVKQKSRDSESHFLLEKFISKKINRLINLIANIMFALFGLALVVNDNVLKAPITIGLFLIIIGIKSMTGEFSGKKDDFSEERFSEKTNFVIGLITSILIMSVGIGILIWYFFISKA